jgi:hypothetical protein
LEARSHVYCIVHGVKCKGAERRGVLHLYYQNPVTDGECACSPGIADLGLCSAALADNSAIHDQSVGLGFGAAFVEHRVQLQCAAIGDVGARAGDSGLASAGYYQHVPGCGVALQVDRA